MALRHGALFLPTLKENKDYKEFKGKDCREVYSLKVLFEDAYDNDKYAVTPSTMCRTGFSMFEDSGLEDLRDSQPLDEEGTGSSDESEKTELAGSSADMSRPQSGDNRRSGGNSKKGKRAKMPASDVSDAVNRASTASEKVAATINNLLGPNVPDAQTLMNEMLSTGRLHKKTDMYFWTLSFLSLRRNREIIAMQEDANDKELVGAQKGSSEVKSAARKIFPLQQFYVDIFNCVLFFHFHFGMSM
ncbi:uncharacterized protein LOC111405725 [Olea europaea var. sylvestris]|uniref:uncharacterized protein LOC111405725 n=1 Tax=Olea europaea var. sylvestris TaxID=158386 RepID=UPI000C1CF898|nr:uncharacterized protein LOC111405725 [Olea europaea var. sylvestris]